MVRDADEVVEPAIWGAVATVSGVACLAIDLALTRLTEIRDALVSGRAILAPVEGAAETDPDTPAATGPTRSLAELEAAISRAKGRQDRPFGPQS
ncbi:hypothetical protein SAMN05444722_1003 [Rhodovulum sp. ES.010]|uniref:hypothetical protein n=1 Tax=Rhodovulum sp. ES.010 TaxID=1882821 RepID=UPI00092B40C4|nr:hypothetical protein [Rhodovulum sp. ES.010]SIO24654.1 hypothetical protein SAMN05444722_1003 [Rhodovulum sp. ES.010]